MISVYEHIHVSQGIAFFKELQERVCSCDNPPVQKRLKGKITSNPREIHCSQETHPIDKDQTGNEETQLLFPAASFPSGQPHYISPSLCRSFSCCPDRQAGGLFMERAHLCYGCEHLPTLKSSSPSKGPPRQISWLLFSPSHWREYRLINIGRESACSFTRLRKWLKFSLSSRKLVRTTQNAQLHKCKIREEGWKVSGVWNIFGQIDALAHPLSWQVLRF